MLKINFSDMWVSFDKRENEITKVLERNSIAFEISDSPRYLFYSVFGNDHLNFDCIKVFITGEAITPDFNYCDYAVGFDYISFKDRYLRWPFYRNSENYFKEQRKFYSIPISKLNFCSFVYSNKAPFIPREDFFNQLSKYKRVNSGGKYINNIGGQVKSKLEFEKSHKFSICFENTIFDGYTSEKLLDGFEADTIPIYYGNPSIGDEFYSDSFINLHEFASFDDAIHEIIRVDQNDSEYLKILNNVRMKPFDKNLFDRFIIEIINNPNKRITVNYWIYRSQLLNRFAMKLSSLVLLPKFINYIVLRKAKFTYFKSKSINKKSTFISRK